MIVFVLLILILMEVYNKMVEFIDNLCDRRFCLYFPNQKECSSEWLEKSLDECFRIVNSLRLHNYEIVESFVLVRSIDTSEGDSYVER